MRTHDDPGARGGLSLELAAPDLPGAAKVGHTVVRVAGAKLGGLRHGELAEVRAEQILAVPGGARPGRDDVEAAKHASRHVFAPESVLVVDPVHAVEGGRTVAPDMADEVILREVKSVPRTCECKVMVEPQGGHGLPLVRAEISRGAPLHRQSPIESGGRHAQGVDPGHDLPLLGGGPPAFGVAVRTRALGHAQDHPAPGRLEGAAEARL